MVKPNEIVDKSKFDLELKEDSVGNSDLELLKILRKARYKIRVLSLYLEYSYILHLFELIVLNSSS
jgi:hypothetical protein